MAGISGEYIYDSSGKIIGATGSKLGAWRKMQSDPEYFQKMGAKSSINYMNQPKSERKPKGFAVLSKEKLSEMGRKGGSTKRAKPNAQEPQPQDQT